MLVFKKNWVYKYNDWCCGKPLTKNNVNDSKTICPYFWGSVWNILMAPIILTWFFVFLGVLFSIPIGQIDLVKELLLNLDIGTRLIFVIFIGWLFAFICSGIVILLVYTIIKVREKLCKIKINTKPNIFVEYVKAKKDKYCPMIKWEDKPSKGED